MYIQFSKMVSMPVNCSWQELCVLVRKLIEFPLISQDTDLKFVPFNVTIEEVSNEITDWIDSLWCW